MSRLYNLRRIRTNISYSFAEIARLHKVSPTTVWKWTKQGLETIDDHVPKLVHGSVLKAFLAGRKKPRQPLLVGQIYCVACRLPREPAGQVAAFQPRALTNGDLIGRCPDCGRLMHRRVRTDQLAAVLGALHLVALEHVKGQ